MSRRYNSRFPRRRKAHHVAAKTSNWVDSVVETVFKAVIAGLLVAFLSYLWDKHKAREVALKALVANGPLSGCNEVREAGLAPIQSFEPGYSSEMDGDGDGIACEPYFHFSDDSDPDF